MQLTPCHRYSWIVVVRFRSSQCDFLVFLLLIQQPFFLFQLADLLLNDLLDFLLPHWKLLHEDAALLLLRILVELDFHLVLPRVFTLRVLSQLVYILLDAVYLCQNFLLRHFERLWHRLLMVAQYCHLLVRVVVEVNLTCSSYLYLSLQFTFLDVLLNLIQLLLESVGSVVRSEHLCCQALHLGL